MKKLMIVLVVVAAAAVAYLTLRPAAPAPAPVRDDVTLRTTDSGQVVGYVDGSGARVWKGIPFAAPPVGELRWRAPQPPTAWDGVREALSAGPVCPQLASALAGAAASNGSNMVGQEDCLYLNVFAPENAKGLPVMFWIHGGGNSIGTGATYDGSGLATRRGVVVVTVNYRLGPFGWFAHPDLKDGDPLDDSGNYGTLDVIRALEWTRDNVAAFGGDPNNVTVFGESAGGFDTLAMMASPLAKGLFHRAIVESGGFSTTPMDVAGNFASEGGHPNSAREIVDHLLVRDGTVPDLAAARSYQSDMTSAKLRDYLSGKTAENIFATFDSGSATLAMINVPNNLGDGHVLPAMTTDAIFSNADQYNVVPVILGTNRDEVALFMALNPQYQDRFLWLFPRLKNEAEYLRAVRYGSKAWKARGVDALADAMTASGNPNVYAYRFDWDEEGSRFGYDLSKAFGAAHGTEIAFVFGSFDSSPLGAMYAASPHKDGLSNSMMSYWTQFAVTGNPGTGRDGKEVPWKSWGTDGAYSLLLDTIDGGGIRMGDEKVTIASVKAELAAEPGISAEERCRLYVRSFSMFGMDQDDYRQFGPDGCAQFDPKTLAGF